MKRQPRDHWIDDVASRQRSTVFPETVRNEGRFYRGMLDRGRELGVIHRVGLLVLAVFFGGFSFLQLQLYIEVWSATQGTWLHKALETGRTMILGHVFTFLALFGVFFSVRAVSVIIAAPWPKQRKRKHHRYSGHR